MSSKSGSSSASNKKAAPKPGELPKAKGKLFGQPLGADVPRIISGSLAHLRDTGASPATTRAVVPVLMRGAHQL